MVTLDSIFQTSCFLAGGSSPARGSFHLPNGESDALHFTDRVRREKCGLEICPTENSDHYSYAATCFCFARSPGGTLQRSPRWKRWGTKPVILQPRRGGS